MKHAAFMFTGLVSGYFVTKICQPYIIIQTHQDSMWPTISDGNLFIGVNVHYPKCKIEKQDIVVFVTPKVVNGNELVVKRLANLPLESVSYYDKRSRKRVDLIVPPDHVWLLGDNPSVSIDSRCYGPVPVDRIRYKVLFRFWPLWSAGYVKMNDSYNINKGD